MRSFCLLLSIIFIVGCSSSYEELTNNIFSPPNEFSKHLLYSYKNKAEFEAEKMHDWNSAKLYSEKALKAAKGIKIKPEKINSRNIPSSKTKDLNIAFNNLMLVYEDAIIKNPYHLANAISSLDCWAEQQEENWQTWDIEKCKKDFLNSMHIIYKSLEVLEKDKKVKELTDNEKLSNNLVSVVTKDKKEEILQLIYFDFDKTNLSEVSIRWIKEFIIKYNKKIEKYLIVGHTDSKGSKQYNMNLSLERANAVKKVFIHNGINENRIKIIGMGESNLRIKTEDEVPHPANRRAEITPLN